MDRPHTHRFWEILKYLCYISYLLHNFVSKTVVMKIIVKKCLVNIYEYTAHIFFKLEV